VVIAGHAVCHLANRKVIATDARALRNVAVGVLKVGRPFDLLAFRLADNHLHALVAGDAAAVTEFGRRIEISLQKRLRPGIRFAHVYVTPVSTQRHLTNSFHYIFRQEAHHGTCVDPLFEASNLPDLLGMRTLGQWTAGCVRTHLPRVQREELLEHLPVRLGGPQNPELLGDAAAAAVGVPHIHSRLARAAEARVAAAHLARRWTKPGRGLGPGLSARTLEALRRHDPDPVVLRAVELQLSLRSAWAALQAAQTSGLG